MPWQAYLERETSGSGFSSTDLAAWLEVPLATVSDWLRRGRVPRESRRHAVIQDLKLLGVAVNLRLVPLPVTLVGDERRTRIARIKSTARDAAISRSGTP
jgi:hypothetical protein